MNRLRLWQAIKYAEHEWMMLTYSILVKQDLSPFELGDTLGVNIEGKVRNDENGKDNSVICLCNYNSIGSFYACSG